ncbi:MAG: hypothetical protein B7Z10_06815 [Rhodobacterales bacterium 32-66-7]|nr:MAG: hypothetical protein B7Z10_06815 [Rhodobacterales bacterium 32-66-7]
MDKSPDAFRTISEVADVLGTPAHVLRFWESRFPQIKPVKRAGGRRYYRPSDVALLSGIKRLLHDDGLTIRGVQQVLRDQGVRHVAALSGATGIEADDLDYAGEDDLAPLADDADAEAGFVSVDAEEDTMPDADALLPVEVQLPLFAEDAGLADASLPPLVLHRRPTLREDASVASLIRALPRGALAGHSDKIAALALRLRALRSEMVTRAQGLPG